MANPLAAIADWLRRMRHDAALTGGRPTGKAARVEFSDANPFEGGELPVDPITRQRLDPAKALYRCRGCGTLYGEEGFQFLRMMDRGRCCACRRRGTVHPWPDTPHTLPR